MRLLRDTLIIGFLIASAVVATAETKQAESGGDTFISGPVVNQTLEASGDTFVAARTVVASGQSKGDMHAAGFDVTVNADAGQDLYAAGFSVVVQSKITQDLTASGFSVRTGKGSTTGGNARLFGRTVTIEGPVEGSVLVAAQDVVFNAAIEGDLRVLARSITFGPDAIVAGTFTYAAREKISVPERVATADRVAFEKVSVSDARDHWDDMRKEMPVLPTFASLVFSFVVSLLFFVALGAVVLGFMPKRLSKMRRSIGRAPGQSILLGIIGLSMLLGMVPITALTIVGLPFVPVVVLTIIVAWTLGYALGAYSVAMRIWTGFGGEEDPGRPTRLLVFAGAIIAVALLNFIPFVGWVANYTLVLLGLGAITHAVFQHIIGNPGAAFDIDMKPIED